MCDLVDIETRGSGTDSATLTNRAISTNNSHCVCGHIVCLYMGTENCKFTWLPDMADYHWDPGYLKLAKGVVRVEDRYSLNIHQRDGHYNKRCIQHCMSACHTVHVTMFQYQITLHQQC